MIEKQTCILILNRFYSRANHKLSDEDFSTLVDEYGTDTVVNYLDYLFESGLITSNSYAKKISGPEFSEKAKITAKGINYLEGENSLGHEINVTTIKLHSQTIADLESIIKYSNLPSEEKESLLKELAKHGAKDMVTKSVEYAMTNGGALLMLIQAWLKSQ